MKYAILDKTGLVLDVVVWDNIAPWSPPPGTFAVNIPPESPAGIGWTCANDAFHPPVNDRGAYDLTLDLAAAQVAVSSKIDALAHNLLQPSDWLVARQVEEGTSIPAEWGSWRKEIRDQARSKKASVAVCSSKEELSTYCNSEEFSTWANCPT